MSVYVNVDELREISKDIESRGKAISEIYSSKVVPALNNSKDAIVSSGLNFDDILKTFNTVFNSVNDRLNNLTDVLNNKIIPNYNSLSTSITATFNNEFADSMSNIINSIK